MKPLLRGVIIAVALTAALTPAASAKTLCVGHQSGCYRAIQPAVDAARNGDVVRIKPGTFQGGVTVNKSIRLQGSGAGETRIAGGDHVLTLGTLFGTSAPTIEVDGVTVTRGRATDSFDGTFIARGGGVYIPPGQDLALGADVTITDSVIVRNEAAPETTAPSPSGAQCPDSDCPYAEADGGGIDSWGTLTLDRVVVARNRSAGAVSSDAMGGGIYSHQGDLTIRHSSITGNAAVTVPPNARFAEGAGIFIRAGGTLTIEWSSIEDNAASLTSTWPVFAGDALIDMNAHAGGLHVSSGIPTTIRNVRFTGNVASAFDPAGEPFAFDSAMLIEDSPLRMDNTVFSGNEVRASYADSADVGVSGTVLELDGPGLITDTSITGNSVSAFSRDGLAGASNGLAVYNFSDHEPALVVVRDSVIDRNRTVARSSTGTAMVHGGGIYNNSLLELRKVVVSSNSSAAFGPDGHAQGGGIWNGVELSGPPVELTLKDSLISRNSLTGSAGIALDGGGLFTTEPVTRVRTRIANNRPDDCFGC
jgi:hypothetical protein